MAPVGWFLEFLRAAPQHNILPAVLPQNYVRVLVCQHRNKRVVSRDFVGPSRQLPGKARNS